MKKSEAQAVVRMILFRLTYFRSNIQEALSGKREPSEAELSVMNLTAPGLFSEKLVAPLQLSQRLSEKLDDLTGQDLYNLIYLIERDDLLLGLFQALPVKTELPSSHDVMVNLLDWDPEEEEEERGTTIELPSDPEELGEFFDRINKTLGLDDE